MEDVPAGKIVRAEVPFSEMFGCDFIAIGIAGSGNLFDGVQSISTRTFNVTEVMMKSQLTTHC